MANLRSCMPRWFSSAFGSGADINRGVFETAFLEIWAERFRSAPASDINLLSKLKGVVDFHAQIPDRAFYLRVAD